MKIMNEPTCRPGLKAAIPMNRDTPEPGGDGRQAHTNTTRAAGGYPNGARGVTRPAGASQPARMGRRGSNRPTGGSDQPVIGFRGYQGPVF